LRTETVWKTAGIFNKIKAFFSSFALIYQQTFIPQNPITGVWPLRNLAATRIHVECEGFGGHQEDIFKTGERSSLNDGVVVDDEYEWCRNYTFTNLDKGERIDVAYGVVEYIKRYGFYEGNVPYRVDPIKLVSVLTGVPLADLQAYARSRSS
jgi:hypothetical protein